MASLIDIFKWFETGKIPTQEHFKQTFLSFWHKDEMIPQASVIGLADDLDNKAEREALNSHLNDPDAHAELIAEIDTPFRFLTMRPVSDVSTLQNDLLIGAELDALAALNQLLTDGFEFDAVTGTITYTFYQNTKYIIFYTKP